MEFDKTNWSSSSTHRYNALFEGHSSQARQNCTQNSARGIKTCCLNLDIMQLLLVRFLTDLQENYFKSFFLCFQWHFWCQCCQFSKILGQSEVSDSMGFQPFERQVANTFGCFIVLVVIISYFGNDFSLVD